MTFENWVGALMLVALVVAMFSLPLLLRYGVKTTVYGLILSVAVLAYVLLATHLLSVGP